MCKEMHGWSMAVFFSFGAYLAHMQQMRRDGLFVHHVAPVCFNALHWGRSLLISYDAVATERSAMFWSQRSCLEVVQHFRQRCRHIKKNVFGGVATHIRHSCFFMLASACCVGLAHTWRISRRRIQTACLRRVVCVLFPNRFAMHCKSYIKCLITEFSQQNVFLNN